MRLDKKQQDLIDHNYVVAMGLLISNSIIGEFFNNYKMSIFNSGAPSNQFNIAFVKETTTKPEKHIQTWEQFFASRGLHFRVSFRPGLEKDFESLLVQKGYKENRPEPVMTLSHLSVKTVYHKDLEIKPVSDLNELSHFQEIIEKSYSLPEGSGPYVITERIMNLPDVKLLVGYADHQPACTSMLVKTGPVAGIYWVATLEKFRNHGFGKSITQQSLVAGEERGCEFACLQASAMGKPVYESLGFDTPYHYRNYASPEHKILTGYTG